MAEARDTLNELARQACEQATGIEDAIEILEGHVRQKVARTTWNNPVSRELVAIACANLVYQSRGLIKKGIKSGRSRQVQYTPPGAGSYSPELVQHAGEEIANAYFLDKWALPNGKALGDATGAELLPFAAQYAEQERGYRNLRRYYEKLHALAGTDRIRDTVSNEKAESLWMEVSGL